CLLVEVQRREQSSGAVALHHVDIAVVDRCGLQRTQVRQDALDLRRERQLCIEPGTVELASAQLVLAEDRERRLNPAGVAVEAPDTRVATPGLRELDDRAAPVGCLRVDVHGAAAAEAAKPDARAGGGEGSDARQRLAP